MHEVKWVKLTTDMFDNRKIKHLRRLPDGNNIVLIWVMLLTIAGRCNAGGNIFLTENIPYDVRMLSDELDFKENTVSAALKALEQLDMIATEGGFIKIVGWGEHQNVDGMDKVREQTRKRVAEYKKNKKLRDSSVTDNGTDDDFCNTAVTQCNVTDNVTNNAGVTQGNATEEEREEELKLMAAQYQMDVDKLKEIIGEDNLGFLTKDLQVKKAIDFIYDNAKVK